MITQEQMQIALMQGDSKVLSELFAVDPLVEERNYDVALAEHRRCQMYHKVFTSPEGQEVLQDLYNRHVLTTQFDPRVENAEVTGFYKEGAKSIVLELNRLIQKAGEGPPNPPNANELELG